MKDSKTIAYKIPELKEDEIILLQYPPDMPKDIVDDARSKMCELQTGSVLSIPDVLKIYVVNKNIKFEIENVEHMNEKVEAKE